MMNRAEVIRQIFLWEKVAEQARARAAQFRVMLQADANAEYAEQGTAASWRVPALASVVLPISKTAVVVDDAAALAKWVQSAHPTEVEQVTRVRAAYLPALLRSVQPSGDLVVDEEGTVVPGLKVRPGGQPGSVTLTPEAEARQAATVVADAVLEQVATAMDLPAIPVQAAAGEPDAS